jgi:hypothetical protein
MAGGDTLNARLQTVANQAVALRHLALWMLRGVMPRLEFQQLPATRLRETPEYQRA